MINRRRAQTNADRTFYCRTTCSTNNSRSLCCNTGNRVRVSIGVRAPQYVPSGILNETDFIHALNTAARTIGMTEVAQKAGVTRVSLYKSFAEGGNPKFSTISKVTK